MISTRKVERTVFFFASCCYNSQVRQVFVLFHSSKTTVTKGVYIIVHFVKKKNVFGNLLKSNVSSLTTVSFNWIHWSLANNKR